MLAVIFNSNATNGETTPNKKVSISGAGATFPLPFYNLAFKTYQDKTGNSVTYGGIGSGGGIRSLKDKIVDFGGSDAYLSDKEMSEMPAAVIHIPTCGSRGVSLQSSGSRQSEINRRDSGRHLHG